MHRTRCNGVDVEVVHHPTHGNPVATMARSACAALATYARLFGPYPRTTLRLVENAARDIGAHAEPGLVDYGDGFALLHPAGEPGSLDLVFAVTAHEVAHQWWGQQLAPARVEGAGLLVESLATYSATQVLEQLTKKGRPTRAEVTDAATAQRAECAMLNKGPHVVDAVRELDDILGRMRAHQSKKITLLRRLRSWSLGA